MIVYFASIIMLFVVIKCDFNSEKLAIEEKTAQLWNPSTLQTLWDKNSCYTYSMSIGTCLTDRQCRSRNGTVSGFCLGLYKICCQLSSQININLNTKCNTNSNTTGICLYQNDCIHRQGTPDGYCGLGLTTCCLFKSSCGARITQNETEFVNNLYPKMTYDPNVCQVVIERQPNVCQIRLELVEFQLSQPDTEGQCTTDAFIVKTPLGEQLPIICGANSGQHLYLEMGRKIQKNVMLSVVTNGNNEARKWRIKIIMISCNSLEIAPNGCLQYYLSHSGLVQSFNYGPQIKGRARYMSGLRYSICVRVQENYCWIKWETEYRGSFSFGSPFHSNYSMSSTGASGQPCNGDDFISIDGGITEDVVPEDDRICGNKFLKYGYVISQSKPFLLKVMSNSNHKLNTLNSQFGFSLRFMQLSCS